MKSLACVPAALAAALLLAAPVVQADETCNSPYMAKLIKGQEDYVYVWTLGVDGLGDGSDKLVTIDVDPKSKTYGKVIAQASVGTRGEEGGGGQSRRNEAQGFHARDATPRPRCRSIPIRRARRLPERGHLLPENVQHAARGDEVRSPVTR